MTQSRKLLIAAILLAGGYGLALLFGRGSDLLATSMGSGAAEHHTSWFAGLKDFVARDADQAATGLLVPEIPDKVRPGQGAFAARRAPDHPILLTATPQVSVPAIAAAHPSHAEAPALSASTPPTLELAPPAARAHDFASSQPAVPQARITNVVAASDNTSHREASPWDRWPRWDANATDQTSAPVAATFQDSNPAPARMIPTTFSDAAVIAKNTPALDAGPDVERIGRTHVVIDGDSLPRLAERYLDDAALDNEIYRLNRDVLSSPDLLPIGVELRIPDDRMANSTVGRPSAGSLASAGTVSAPSSMVPVDWTPRPFDGPPRAELLRPIPTGRTD